MGKGKNCVCALSFSLLWQMRFQLYAKTDMVLSLDLQVISWFYRSLLLPVRTLIMNMSGLLYLAMLNKVKVIVMQTN